MSGPRENAHREGFTSKVIQITRPIEALLRMLPTALTSEPWWARGLNWRLVGAAAALTLTLAVAVTVGWVDPAHDEWQAMTAEAMLVLTLNAISGVSVLLIASTLANLRRPRVPLPLALAVAVVTGPLIGHIFMALANFHDRPPRLSTLSGTVMFVVVRALLIAAPWAVAAAAWYFSRRAALRVEALRATELDRGRLEAGMTEARLGALHAQIEPHFLFNTLAHVKRLYRTDPRRARMMLDSFRDYLHSALPQMREHTATLGREIDLARAYLDVQQIRMGRRLAVSLTVPAGLRAHPFPPMMLISLVENAIKHGLNPLPEGGSISIVATRGVDTISVVVADSGRGIGDQLGCGVGLANIRGRLTGLFGLNGRLSLAPLAPHGVAASIRIPIEDTDFAVGDVDSGVARAEAA